VENKIQLESGALTQIGGRSSGTEEKTSLTSIIERYLMFHMEKMLKDKLSGFGTDIIRPIRDGELSMLTKLRRKEEVDTTVNTDSTSTELSTSDQECQCKELLKMSLTILELEDMPVQEEEDNKLGSSIEFRIPSSLNTPDLTPFTWQATTVILTSD
jgi:hypothetical protein